MRLLLCGSVKHLCHISSANTEKEEDKEQSQAYVKISKIWQSRMNNPHTHIRHWHTFLANDIHTSRSV